MRHVQGGGGGGGLRDGGAHLYKVRSGYGECVVGMGSQRTATSANVPLGSIATSAGHLNRALAAAPSRKPEVPSPASVVVDPVARSMRRMRSLE